ncbi:barstar family protein [Nocardia flavorosea]|uniref:Barstar family protein n=1 Tax=Nocardia flavorosea TaxID=53429 RepID=A0A846YCL9_9NOCA|nr:barstar family protein [Nocardia flavorosea]NKY56813.1 barstar family protein [Nocardia flavorosea]
MPEPLALADFLDFSYDAELRATAAGMTALGTMQADAAEFSGIRYRAPEGFRVRELRGSRMRTVAGLYDEFAAALQFPYYFRPNKDSFDECLLDIDDTLGEATGYVLAIRDADQLLAQAPEEREWFASVVEECADFWPSRDVVFRVILQGGPQELGAVPIHF